MTLQIHAGSGVQCGAGVGWWQSRKAPERVQSCSGSWMGLLSLLQRHGQPCTHPVNRNRGEESRRPLCP